MGNGVGLSANYDQRSAEFAQLEKLCQSGYFHQNIEEYRQAVTLAIQTNKLDCLELLIISGNCKNIMPVHLAAKMGKLEPLELLLSAGFPGNSIDKEGRTPLHLTAFSSSHEISLVVSLLCLSFPQSIRRYDREGYHPIHIAIIENNALVIETLLQNGATFQDLTQSGKNLFQLAKSENATIATSVLSEIQSKRSEERKGSTSKKQKKETAQTESAVSQERIMQIWERFFDNAFKNAGVTMEEEEEEKELFPKKNNHHHYNKRESKLDDRFEDYSYDSYESKHDFYSSPSWKEDQTYLSPSFSTSSSKSQRKMKQKEIYSKDSKKEKRKSKKEKREREYLYLEAEEKPYDYPTEPSTIRDLPPREDWFDWIVCYDETVEDLSEAYFVLNRVTKEKRWLNDHWNLLQRSQQYPFLYESEEIVASWSFPSSLWEVSAAGWCTYYDHSENVCWWMNLVTNLFEYYLPLGFENDIEELRVFNLFSSVDYPGWVEADQSCATSWILVLFEDPYSPPENNQYYLNTTTNQTRWDPPTGWFGMIESWNGWIPCASENQLEEIFWYNPETGESSWG